MKLTTTGLAIITALLMHLHSISPALADHTRDLNDSSSAGFSLQLVAIPDGRPDHGVRRGSDGFLYLQRSTSAANLSSVLPAAYRPSAVTVQVGTGNGKRELTLKVSTTSPLTWLQCKPCSPMAPQTHPLFDPAASPTYHAFTSASPRCPQPPYQHEPGTGLCAFHLAGEASASGYLSTDHFRINSGGVDPFYAFGCAHFTDKFHNGGTAAGVLSVSRAPASIATQATARGLTSFSYCLSGETKTRRGGFLRFGADVPSDPRYRSTRILPPALGAHDSAYYVSLVGVSVGERRLAGIRPEMFGHGGGGCIVDIGAPVTELVESAYRIVEEAMWSGLERRGAERLVEQGRYGLCVRATAAVRGHLPSLSLHFCGEDDATLLISPEQLFLMVDDERAGQVACLALVPGRRTVIGALQQVDTRFVFDLKDNKLSFAPESCVQNTMRVA
ncbi:unnamed protein product [Urochloa decumbens]|uniref:Peptidase A1 domain-containing protein n=1 Tax=Urochloa decumbens TaxID=240449 RepID=A0ABC9AYQ3_9POAL